MQSLNRRCHARTTLGTAHLFPAIALLAAGCAGDAPIPVAPRIEQASATALTNVTILPTLGGAFTTANDINDAGQVVGWSTDATATRRAFVWSPRDGMQDLGTLGGTTSEANAINAAGQIVGLSETADRRTHAFLWTVRGGMQDLGAVGTAGTVAVDINNRGEIVGFDFDQVGSTIIYHALRWDEGGNVLDLGTLGGSTIAATAINNAGEIVGSGVTAGGNEHAFLWTSAAGLIDLGAPNGAAAMPTSINSRGDIVGIAIVQPDAHPFWWNRRDGLTMLGTLGGPDVGLVHDINDAGEVVGSIAAMPGGRHAFVWSSTHGMEDLFAATGMREARAINNRGQIVGGDRVATIRTGREK